jgi:hypothetical protein
LGSQWGYRKPITISNSGSSALTDYQVLVTNPVYNETGLVLSLHFNEGSGTIAYDSSGFVNTGTLYSGTTVCSNPPTAGCPQWVDGKFGKALRFDGVDDYVRVPVSAGSSLDFAGKNKITVVAWVKALSSVTTNTDTFIGQDTSFFMRWRQGGGNNWGAGIYNGAWRELSVPGALNTWTHLALVYDGSILKLYKDGVLAASLTTSGNLVANVKEINIGRFPTATTQRFNGIIDEVRIYNRALSDAEIQALYQAKARLDYGDIRFTDSDGSTLLNYWQEADGRFWVKVPSIPASSTKTIYVYYGNPSATSQSDRSATMLWFDDFSSNTLTQYTTAGLSAGPTITSGYIEFSTTSYGIVYPTAVGDQTDVCIRTRVMVSSGNWWGIWARSNANPSSWTSYGFDAKPPAGVPEKPVIERFNSGVRTQLSGASNSMANGVWYNVSACIFGTGSTVSLRYNVSTFPPLSYDDTSASRITTAGKVGMGAYESTTVRYDYFEIRKYTSPEPTTSVGSEEVLSASNFIYTQSPAVSSNPSATYTCPSCQYSSNTYYGVAYSVDESVWTAFTAARTFTCKMEASQSGSCSCTSNTQCYNPCNVNWGTYYDGYCYNNKCYDAIPGSVFGLTQSCLAGTLLNHETSSGRYANVNGRLYYCKGSDNSTSPYPFVFNLSPGSSVGNCKCRLDGSWSCPTGIIPIRGGRIKIV